MYAFVCVVLGSCIVPCLHFLFHHHCQKHVFYLKIKKRFFTSMLITGESLLCLLRLSAILLMMALTPSRNKNSWFSKPLAVNCVILLYWTLTVILPSAGINELHLPWVVIAGCMLMLLRTVHAPFLSLVHVYGTIYLLILLPRRLCWHLNNT